METNHEFKTYFEQKTHIN